MNFKNLFYIGICALSAQGAWATERPVNTLDELAETYGISRELIELGHEVRDLCDKLYPTLDEETPPELMKQYIDNYSLKMEEFVRQERLLSFSGQKALLYIISKREE